MANGERRKYKRHDINDLVIAVPNRYGSQIARVINISEGGLAVKYTDDLEWLGEAEEIDIIVNRDFLLTHIPIVSVDDFEIGQGPFSTVDERQTCIKFGRLSTEQKKIIDEIIELYNK